MSQAPDAVVAGSLHNKILNATRDTVHGFDVLPGLILAMLNGDRWRELVRPVDAQVFKHHSVEEWVLGPAWAGLNYPSWDALYAVLDRAKEGPECKARLIALGAPANGAAADARPVRRHGGAHEQVDNIKSVGGSSVEYIAGRLKRDHPELAEEVIAGRISAHAAAVQVGIRKATWTAPADPERLAEAIERRFGGEFVARLRHALPEVRS